MVLLWFIRCKAGHLLVYTEGKFAKAKTLMFIGFLRNSCLENKVGVYIENYEEQAGLIIGLNCLLGERTLHNFQE